MKIHAERSNISAIIGYLQDVSTLDPEAAVLVFAKGTRTPIAWAMSESTHVYRDGTRQIIIKIEEVSPDDVIRMSENEEQQEEAEK